MYAIIATGGKQYRVSQGDVIFVEKIEQDVDSTIEVVAQVKGEKIIIYKYKSKKNYHRRAGHRQPYTKVEITGINA